MFSVRHAKTDENAGIMAWRNKWKENILVLGAGKCEEDGRQWQDLILVENSMEIWILTWHKTSKDRMVENVRIMTC